MTKRHFAIALKMAKKAVFKGILFAVLCYSILIILTSPSRFDSMNDDQKYAYALEHEGDFENEEFSYYLDFYVNDENSSLHDWGAFITVESIDWFLNINEFDHSHAGQRLILGSGTFFLKDAQSRPYVLSLFEKRKATIEEANFRITVFVFLCAFIPLFIRLIMFGVKQASLKIRETDKWINDNAK